MIQITNQLNVRYTNSIGTHLVKKTQTLKFKVSSVLT